MKIIDDLMRKNSILAEKSKFHELRTLIVQWSTERQIIQNSTIQAQTLKAVSEMGELADAVAKNNAPEIVDAIGDVMVCLINICAIQKIDIVECLESAYMQIKDRRGKMTEGGVFVKE